MNEGRKIRFYESNYINRKWVRTEGGEGVFLAFGVDAEENCGSFSTAIIELESGSIVNVALYLCEFIK